MALSEVEAVRGVDDGGHLVLGDDTVTDYAWIIDVGGVAVEKEVVPVLVEVDLALGRPGFAEKPEGGPCSTSRPGQVAELSDDEAAVVHGLAFQPHALPARILPGVQNALGPVIDADVHFPAVGPHEPELLGGAPLLVLDVTAGRVGYLSPWCEKLIITKTQVTFYCCLPIRS